MGPENFRNIKAEKAKAIQRFRRMEMITAAFRFVEFCVFLGIICRVSAHFNVSAFKFSGEYFRGISVALISPRLVFVVGNVIFIVLFLQSGHSPEKHGSGGNEKGDFYEEYMKESGNKNQSFYSNYNGEIKKQVKQTTACSYYAKERRMQRSQSENLKRLNCGAGEEAPGRELRRSATSVSRRKSKVATEEMSSEDFRRKVEDFIARQQRALREEEFSSVFGST